MVRKYKREIEKEKAKQRDSETETRNKIKRLPSESVSEKVREGAEG